MASKVKRIFVIADDVTGCHDAAAPFACYGVTTRSLQNPYEIKTDDSTVVAISTNSRNESPDIAANKVEAICEVVSQIEHNLVFKKIDSTGKGNIGREIEAVLQAFPAQLAIVCPAFPEQGRTMTQGWVRVHNDADGELDLYEAIASQTNIPIIKFSRDKIDLLPDHVQFGVIEKKQIILVDAETSEDLDTIAQVIQCQGERSIAIGSSGLAKALAPYWCDGPLLTRDPLGWQEAGSFFVIFAGSKNDTTLSQIACLESARNCTHVALRKPFELELREARVLPYIVDIVWNQEQQEALGVSLNQLSETTKGTVFLTGGDTANFVLQGTGTSCVEILGEITSGIPWGIALDGQLKGCQVITKAGGFGRIELLANIVGHLKFSQRPVLRKSMRY